MAAAPMSLEQFGQTIKAKHPEYGDLSDADVATKVLAKYPQYHDMVQATPAATEEKSLWQKAKDNFNANTQGAQPGDGAVKGFIENIGQGGGQALRGIAHPLDAISGIAHMVAHPADQAHAEVDALRADPSRFIGNAIGQTGAGAILGEGLAAGTSAVNGAVSSAAGKAALLGKTPAEAYETALKPPTTMSSVDRAQAAQAGLKNEIPISSSGVEKIADRIDALNQGIKDEIATDPTRPIDPNKVATRADRAKAAFSKQVNSQPDLKAIEATRQQFLEEQGQKPAIPAQPTGILDAQGNPIMKPAQAATPAPPMNAIDAQEMKQGTYKILKGKFGEQGSAAVEGQKDLARGLKEEIADQFPEVANMNAHESELLNLQPLVERAVARMANQGLFRLGTGAVAGTVKALGGSNKVAAVAAVMKQVLDDPMIKSRLAIAVSKGGKIPYAEAAARVGAYSSSLQPTVSAPQGYSSGDNPAQSTNGQP